MDDDAGGDDDPANETYPLSHYEKVEKQWNSSMPFPWSGNVAYEKNLSTTKTPFLPSEHAQPEHWPSMVGGAFLCLAIGLIVATIVRNVRSRMKRKNYEEIQNLVV